MLGKGVRELIRTQNASVKCCSSIDVIAGSSGIAVDIIHGCKRKGIGKVDWRTVAGKAARTVERRCVATARKVCTRAAATFVKGPIADKSIVNVLGVRRGGKVRLQAPQYTQSEDKLQPMVNCKPLIVLCRHCFFLSSLNISFAQ